MKGTSKEVKSVIGRTGSIPQVFKSGEELVGEFGHS